MKQSIQHHSLANSRATLVTTEHFSGPLPHPKTLGEYESVVAGAAERILQKFESQADHRQTLESWVIKTDAVKSILGLACGFVIAMTAIVGGIYTTSIGNSFLGGSLSFAGLALLVGAFITNKRSSQQSPDS